MPQWPYSAQPYSLLSLLVWNQLKDLAYQSGKTAYRIKYGLLHDYLVRQLKSPAVEMVLA